MKITITHADNGYIMVTDYETEDPQIPEIKIFEYSGEYEKEHEEPFKGLVMELAEKLDISYDKYAKNNLKISFDEVGKKV